ncbi:STE family protein kinase, partial [Aphelenchoides avenae]
EYDEERSIGVVKWVREMLAACERPPASPAFEDFVEKCLQSDPAARPTVADLLEHAFIKRADRRSLKSLIAGVF